MSNVINVGGINLPVTAETDVFLDPQGNPVPVTKENALPVVVRGFQIPDHNDVEIDYLPGTRKPSYMTFRLNGTEVYWLMFSYDGSGNLTRIQPD